MCRKTVGFSMVLAATLCLTAPVAAWAEATRVEVRVISKGAKFVGTSMGGVLVTLTDAQTGELLASGVTAGSTGDTERIMKRHAPKHASVATEDAAKFVATLDLEDPRLVEVSAYGPLAQLQSANRVSATQWVLPGKHVEGGDGWVLELPGFVVDVLDPPAHLKLSGTPQHIKVRANVTMMCGCPITPGGLWDAERFEIVARAEPAAGKPWETRLRYAGSPSQFEADIELEEPGTYKIVVYAYDATNGNTGLDRTTVVVRE